MKCVLGLSCVVHVQFDALTVAPGGGGGVLKEFIGGVVPLRPWNP